MAVRIYFRNTGKDLNHKSSLYSKNRQRTVQTMYKTLKRPKTKKRTRSEKPDKHTIRSLVMSGWSSVHVRLCSRCKYEQVFVGKRLLMVNVSFEKYSLGLPF